jgi:hypothetical protein
VRFHDLRHTCAILLLTKGVHPMVVSEMLGHYSIAITLDIYSHVIPGLEDAAARVMEDVLGDDPGVGGAGGQKHPVTLNDCIMRALEQVLGCKKWR